jgi:hypothetical protein
MIESDAWAPSRRLASVLLLILLPARHRQTDSTSAQFNSAEAMIASITGHSMSNKGQFQSQPDPNPSQIAARAKRIRSGWTDNERLVRHAVTIGLSKKDKRLPRIVERAKHFPDTSGEP